MDNNNLTKKIVLILEIVLVFVGLLFITSFVGTFFLGWDSPLLRNSFLLSVKILPVISVIAVIVLIFLKIKKPSETEESVGTKNIKFFSSLLKILAVIFILLFILIFGGVTWYNI